MSVPHGENVMLQDHVGCHAEAGGGASASARSDWLAVTSLISRLSFSIRLSLMKTEHEHLTALPFSAFYSIYIQIMVKLIQTAVILNNELSRDFK